MCFFWVGNSITIGVALQLVHSTLPDFLARLRTRSIDGRCDRRRGQMVYYEFVYTGEVDIDAADAHFYTRKASFRCKTPQFVCSGSLPRSGEASGDFMAHELIERCADRSRVNAKAIGIPNAKRKATAVIKHPTHLLQRDRFVWEKL